MSKTTEWINKNKQTLILFGILIAIVAGFAYVILGDQFKPSDIKFNFAPIGKSGKIYVIEGTVSQSVEDLYFGEDEFIRLIVRSIEPLSLVEILKTEVELAEVEGEEIPIPIPTLADLIVINADYPFHVADQMIMLAKPGDVITLLCKEGDAYFFDCELAEVIYR